MNALVVYESIYGNTRQIAEAVADGLGGAKGGGGQRRRRERWRGRVAGGGWADVHGLATSLSRRMAVEAANEDGDAEVEPGAADEPGLRR